MPLATDTFRKFTDAMFHGIEMKISSHQFVDNIQEQFAKFTSDKPLEIAAALIFLWGIGGTPLFSLRTNSSASGFVSVDFPTPSKPSMLMIPADFGIKETSSVLTKCRI